MRKSLSTCEVVGLTKKETLLAFAEEHGYPVVEPPPDGILDSVTIITPRGTQVIFQRQTGREDPEIVESLAHELGHCETDGFYTELSAPAARYRAEEMARRWSYKKTVPLRKIVDAIARREAEPWQLAEELGVPERMIRAAIGYYRDVLAVAFALAH